MSQTIRVTLDLTVDDDQVAGYLVLAVSDDPIAWGLEAPKPLSEAVAGFLIDAIAPTPDPEVGDFLDRYNAGNWLKAVAIDADYGEDDQDGEGGQQ
jgi:hypothetical protein